MQYGKTIPTSELELELGDVEAIPNKTELLYSALENLVTRLQKDPEYEIVRELKHAQDVLKAVRGAR
jgi:hypothetical protein